MPGFQKRASSAWFEGHRTLEGVLYSVWKACGCPRKGSGSKEQGCRPKSTQKWELSSHILSDAEYEWLGDLLSSPDVYMYDSSVGIVPVTITNSNYEQRTYLNSRMERRLELEIEYSNPYNAQNL